MSEINKRLSQIVKDTNTMYGGAQPINNPREQAIHDLSQISRPDFIAQILKGQSRVTRKGKFDPNGKGVAATYEATIDQDGSVKLTITKVNGNSANYEAKRISETDTEVNCPKSHPVDPSYLKRIFRAAFYELNPQKEV